MSDPWIPVGDLARGFEPDGDVLPATADLAGRTLGLHFDDGSVVEHRFVDEQTLLWSIRVAAAEPGGASGSPNPPAGVVGWDRTDDGLVAGEGREEAYRAVRLRPAVYFVDYLRHREPSTSVSLVLDLDQAICTAVIGRLPTREEAERALLRRSGLGLELTAVAVTFAHGAIDGPFTNGTARHEETTDLIGKRVEYTYSPTEQYEHVYLNENLYTWHCLRGVEKGLADTDRCHYYKLADRLYLFVWREKLVPTLGVVVADYAAERSSGKIFGYEGEDPSGLANFPIGAKGRVLNVTSRG